MRIRIGGTSLYCAGSGAGSPVLLVHGSASDVRTWDGLAPALSTRLRVIRYSRRHHWPNDPPAPHAGYSMTAHVDDLLALVDRLELTAAHVVGHSYGAYLALLAAIRRPDRIASLVLAEPPVVPLLIGYPPQPARLFGLLFSRPRTHLALVRFIATGLAPASAAARRGDLEAAMTRFGRAVLGPGRFAELSEERRKQIERNFFAAELLDPAAMAPVTAAEVNGVRVPVLLVSGARSPALFSRLTDRLRELLPRSEHVVIPGASHDMQESHPATFNAAVAEFLSDAATGG